MNQMGLSKEQMIVLPKASKSNQQPLSLGPLCLGIPALSSRMEHRDSERQRVILTPSHGCCTENYRDHSALGCTELGQAQPSQAMHGV